MRKPFDKTSFKSNNPNLKIGTRTKYIKHETRI